MFDETIDVMTQGGTPVIARIYTQTGGIENKVEIGDVLEEIKNLQKEILFLKEYKSHRVCSIDEKIAKHDANVELLKKTVLEYMQSNKETKIDCPDVGAVTARKTKGTYIIEDESQLTVSLEKTGVLTDVASQQWKIDKKKLNKLLDEMKSNGNLPAGVKQEQDKTSLSISFADSVKPSKKSSENVQVEDFDKISI